MSVARRRLLMGRGRGGYVDDFTALSTRWDVQAGTLAVSGGALQAPTLGDWGPNIVANPEFTVDLTGWTTYRATAARVDTGVDPGAASPSADEWAAKVTVGDYSGGLFHNIAGTLVAVPSCQYRWGAYCYKPAATTRIELRQSLEYWTTYAESPAVSVDDTWELLSRIGTIRADKTEAHVLIAVAGNSNVGYVDGAFCLRQNAPALLAGWRSPNHVATLSHVSPASGVVPFGYICRYTDSLNYWEVRVLPNTAGNDLQIIQVTAGVETTRAEADVDWTSDDTDELMVDCRGSTIATYHRKSGAGTWTAGPSYASATQGQTSPDVGVMLYEASVGRLSGFEIRAL